MKLEDYLLVCLIEEAAEVQQAASKALRFGFDVEFEVHKNVSFRKMLTDELNDLLGVVSLLGDQGSFGFIPNEEAIQIKKDKILKWLPKSRVDGARYVESI